MKYFIYKTTNLINNKTYIGMHQTNNVDDGYLGSGVILLKAIKKYNKENFKREILEFCGSYNELIECEKFYVDEKVVMAKDNYNVKTGGQSSGILSDESKNKISNTLKKKYKSGELIPNYNNPYIATDEQKEKISNTLKERYKNVVHHRKGKEPWNKGKVGVQKSKFKGKKSIHQSWCKGLKIGPMSDEQKEKISNTLKERYKNVVHHSKGEEPWNKGCEMKKIECPHCGKLIDVANGKRWHFDNCKFNTTK